MFRSRTIRRAAAVAVSAVTVLLVAQSSHADALCRSVEGRYVEHDTSGSGCTSPVGLCIAGEYRGTIDGSFSGQATTIIPTVDTPTTGVILFTSDSTINARIDGRSGTLIVKNTGAFAPTGDGSIVDLQTIVGGTGAFGGASGAIRAEGTFVAGSGESRYTGTVCLP